MTGWPSEMAYRRASSAIKRAFALVFSVISDFSEPRDSAGTMVSISTIFRPHTQAETVDAVSDRAGVQSFLDSSGVGADQTSGTQQHAAEIAGHYHADIGDACPGQYRKHRPSGCSRRFSVVGAAAEFTALADDHGAAVMPRIPVLFPESGDHLICLLSRADKGNGRDEPRFFFCYLGASAFKQYLHVYKNLKEFPTQFQRYGYTIIRVIQSTWQPAAVRRWQT